jgi:transcriptional regulator with XRE-family HTH domain
MNEKSNRIDLLLKELKLSSQEFADKMDISVNGVYNWKKRDLGSSVINKIVKVFPQVNAEWLLTGNGEILKSTEAAAKTFIPTGNKLHDDVIEELKDLTYKFEQPRPTTPTDIILDIYSRCIRQLEDDRAALKVQLSEIAELRKQMEKEIQEIKSVKELLHESVYALRTAKRYEYESDKPLIASEPVSQKEYK